MQELEEKADFKTYSDSTRRLAQLAEVHKIEAPSIKDVFKRMQSATEVMLPMNKINILLS